MDQAKDNFPLVAGRGSATATASAPRNVLVRAGKGLWTGVKRVNKVVGAAEARLILRVFYLTVIGSASLALRKSRRKSIEAEEHADVTWSPRVSPGTDPNKQY